MKHKTTSVLKTTLFLATAVFASTTYAAQVDIDRIEVAASSLDVATLKTLSSEFSGYDAALANYRLAVSANLTSQSDVAEQAIDQAMEILEQLTQEQTSNVEVKALLAQVYGYKIALSPIKGIVYGPKSQNTLSAAEALAPSNPRVLLVKGIGAINTPPMFGGSKEVALASFNQAIEAYSDDVYSNYYWGHSEAYTWRGMLRAQQGELGQAIADWNKALEIDPNYGWAKSLLAQNSK